MLATGAKQVREGKPFEASSWGEVVARTGTINVAYAAQPAAKGLVWERLTSKPSSGRELTDSVAPNSSKLAAELSAKEVKDGLLSFTRMQWEAACERAVFDVGERCPLMEGDYLCVPCGGAPVAAAVGEVVELEVEEGDGIGQKGAATPASKQPVWYRAVGPFGRKETMVTGSKLRTLELYCGRAMWSERFKSSGECSLVANPCSGL